MKWVSRLLAHFPLFAPPKQATMNHHDRVVERADKVIPRVRNLRISVGFQEADRTALRRPR